MRPSGGLVGAGPLAAEAGDHEDVYTTEEPGERAVSLRLLRESVGLRSVCRHTKRAADQIREQHERRKNRVVNGGASVH